MRTFLSLLLIDFASSWQSINQMGPNRFLTIYNPSLRSSILKSTEAPSEPSNAKIKLPVVQIFRHSELISEFICGSDVLGNYGKIQATLKQLMPDPESESTGSSFVNAIYDDSQLIDQIKTSDVFVLKIYRLGCKKCNQFEPLYIDLAEDPKYKHINWFQADVEYIPNYVKALKERLVGG
mmetsp:Transcript_8957/g.9009  ORF Transcript_8957/g.9009 Transcript_8957/m.9009 type:complete len:180 (+) Transcript_8957:33-572(+)